MHKFTLLLKKESRSIIAFAILSAILVTLLLLDFDKNLFSEIFHDICVYTREFVGYSTVFCILVLLFFGICKTAIFHDIGIYAVLIEGKFFMVYNSNNPYL